MFAPPTSTVVPSAADIVIVGGGIAGVSLAAELGGRARVVVLEAEGAFFRHTSSRSAQQVQPSYGPPPVRRLTSTTLGLLRDLDAGADSPVLSPRILYVISLVERAATPGQRVATPAEVEAAFPALLPGIVHSVTADDEASEVRVDGLLQRYARTAQAHGVEFVSGARVTAVSRAGSGYRLETAAGAITAPIVVNAAGAWADELAALAGAARRGLSPMRRSVILATPTGTPVGADWPMIYDAAGTVYFRPRGADILASPLEDEPSEPEDAHPRGDVVARTLDRVNALTSFGLAAAHESWTGLRTVSPDDLPVIGFDGEHSGFYWLAGQGGYGIQTSAAIAALAAADVLGEELALAPDDRLAFRELSPNRF